VGDLDSVHPGVREAYEKCGTDIIYDPDQNSTDLTKSLRYIRWLVDEGATDAIDVGAPDGKRALDIVTVGGLSGRVDQAFSLIHHLYLAAQDQTLLRGEFFLVGSDSVSFLLKQGMNRNYVPRHEAIFGQNVGIIPVGKEAIISTKGLEWDVQEWRTAFGGRMSTSNHIIADVIEIITSERVLFTVELEKT
jgi:thiamine pyrophosphokinase